MSFYTFSIPSVSFDSHHVLKKQVLHIQQSHCTVFVGPSGVGKSTLFHSIVSNCPLGLKIIYHSQRDLLLPWATALDNVLLGAKLRGSPLPYDAGLHMLKQVGLLGFEGHFPHQLSSGMRKRVALARTFMEPADIILLDEPFETLDVTTRKELYSLTHRLLKGKTLLMISHDKADVAHFADHIYVLKGSPAVAEKITAQDFCRFS